MPNKGYKQTVEHRTKSSKSHKKLTMLQRFWSNVVMTDTCWIYIGNHNSKGYGVIKFRKEVGGKTFTFMAHRYSYELLFEKIPSDMTIDHLCKEVSCVNPKHMEVVTRGENSLRGNGPTAKNKRKTYCNKGHKFDKENTYITKKGFRNCKMCHKNNEKRRYNKIHAKTSR